RWPHGMGMPAVRRTVELAGPAKSLALRRVPIRGTGQCRDPLPGQSPARDNLVSSYGVRHEPEQRRQRVGITACAGPGQLQNRLGAALRVTAPRESPGGGTKTIVRSDDRREVTLPGFLMFSSILGSPLGINRPLGVASDSRFGKVGRTGLSYCAW